MPDVIATLEDVRQAVGLSYEDLLNVARGVQEERAFDAEFDAAKRAGYSTMREHLQGLNEGQEKAQTISELRDRADEYRIWAQHEAESHVDVVDADLNLLSQDDYIAAFVQGGGRAIREDYAAQKREMDLGIGRQQGQSQAARYEVTDRTTGQLIKATDDREGAFAQAAESPNYYVWDRAMRGGQELHPGEPDYRVAGARLDPVRAADTRMTVVNEYVVLITQERQSLDQELRYATAENAADALAMTNHYHGRAVTFNTIRSAAIERYPELRQALPQPFDVDQIRVKNLPIEQQFTQDQMAVQKVERTH